MTWGVRNFFERSADRLPGLRPCGSRPRCAGPDASLRAVPLGGSGAALDLDGGTLTVVRTVVEVSGHTSFKPFPKSSAGRRSVPLPVWLIEIIREHLRRWSPQDGGPVFNQHGGEAAAANLVSFAGVEALVGAGGSARPCRRNR